MECVIPGELAEGLESMWAYMREPDYSTLSSQNTHTYSNQAIWPQFTIVYDPDGDLVDDNLEQMLAEKFSPVLHKHSTDLQQDLQNFENLMADGSFTLNVYDDVGSTLHTEQIFGGTTALHKWNLWNWDTYGYGSQSQGVYNLDLDDNKRYQGAPVGQRPLYYHVYKDANYYYVQYWYYFGMDDKRDQLPSWAETWHESDWEHVSIRVIKNGNNEFVPDLVNFYIHEGGWTMNASQCWWSDTPSLSYTDIQQGYDENHTHLHIWIAANGHASYNRYQEVYERTANVLLGVATYRDRVDYEEYSFDLYFPYDVLVKMGEVTKNTIEECPDSGYSLEYHQYPLGIGSKPWLAYVGRTGDYDDPYFVVFPSPTMPSYEGISHEWMNFTIGFFGFGNGGASWVADDSFGD